MDLSTILAAIKPYVLKWANAEWKPWYPTVTGWGASPPAGGVYRYRLVGKTCTLAIAQPSVATSTTTGVSFTLPFTAATIAGMIWVSAFLGEDNGSILTTPAMGYIASSGTTLIIYKDFSTAAWTASGNKVVDGMITYEVA